MSAMGGVMATDEQQARRVLATDEQKPTRVLVIDDHPLFRKGVADLLALEPNLCLVGEAADGKEGVRLAGELQPDLILLDMNMKGWDGIETLRRLRAVPVSEPGTGQAQCKDQAQPVAPEQVRDKMQEPPRRRQQVLAQDARILMLTVSDNETDVVGALRAGADGYLLKDMEPEDILEQLREAMRGRLVISPQLTDLLARALRSQSLKARD